MNIGANIDALISHSRWMDDNAHNVANVNTRDFKALETTIDAGPTAVVKQTDGAVDLSREIPEQVVIQGGFAAQIPAIGTQDAMLGTLLDLKG